MRLRPAGAGAALAQRRGEVGLRIAERDAVFAIRRAAVGLALDALVHYHQIVAGGAAHLHGLVHHHASGAVERHHVGGAVALAGNDQNAAALQRGIGD